MNIGETIGQYTVTGLLGEGGMGAVYKAIDNMVDRPVAIKVLRPDLGVGGSRQTALLDRFRAEAVTLAKLNHSGIATLYSFQQHGDEFLMIMEYLPGKTLEAVERERGRLPYTTAVPLFGRILEAIEPAHELGILHRDIKPANIMLTTWGGVKVMDFGIARIRGAARQTREGALVGTIEYIAPERVKGQEGDARADIYALGIVLFEMLTGQLPFVSENEFELMRLQLEAAPPPLASFGIEVPPGLETTLRKALSKRPDDRYSTTDEFLEDLRSVGDFRLTKKEVVALVGTVTVQELGTAGHTSSVSGEVFGRNTGAQQLASHLGADSLTVSPVSTLAPSLFARYKIPILGGAALLLAIAGGVGAGLMSRHSTPEPTTQPSSPPATVQPVPSPAANMPVTAPPPVSSAPVSTPQLEPLGIGTPVPLTDTAAPKKADAPKKNSDRKRSALHDESLKALDQ